jgi:hypothetical protein
LDSTSRSGSSIPSQGGSVVETPNIAGLEFLGLEPSDAEYLSRHGSVYEAQIGDPETRNFGGDVAWVLGSYEDGGIYKICATRQEAEQALAGLIQRWTEFMAFVEMAGVGSGE